MHGAIRCQDVLPEVGAQNVRADGKVASMQLPLRDGDHKLGALVQHDGGM